MVIRYISIYYSAQGYFFSKATIDIQQLTGLRGGPVKAVSLDPVHQSLTRSIYTAGCGQYRRVQN